MNEKDPRWVRRLASYKAALSRLGEAVEIATERDLSDLEKQGLIQAFEFTYELSWKVLKDFFEFLGDVNIDGPRDAFVLAHNRKLIKQTDVLIKAIESRNLSAHTYREDVATKVFREVVEHYYSAYVELANRMHTEKEKRGM